MSVYRPSYPDGTPKSPHYHYDFKCGGHRFSGSTGVTERREAERIERQRRDEAKAALKAITTLTNDMTLAEATSRYWLEVGQYAATAGDIIGYMALINRLFGATTPLRMLTSDRIAEAIARRRADTVIRKGKSQLISAATVNRTLTEPLRRVLVRAATVWEKPVPRIKWSALLLAEPQERIREASDAEEATILSTIRDDYRPAIEFMILSGCRLEEVVGLTWDKVYWTANTIEIAGKGRRGSDVQKRVIPITEEIRAILWPLRNDHKAAVFTYRSRKRDPRRLVAKGDVLPITYEGLKTRWRRDQTKVADLHLHDLRHTALTRLVRATGDIQLAQRLAGHKDISTTARYSHVTVDDLRAGMERIKSRKKSRKAPDKGAQ